MAQLCLSMWGCSFLVRRDGHRSCRCGGVDRDSTLDCVAAQPAPRPRGKQRIPRSPASFVKPGGQHRLGCLGERDGPLLASLSLAADMRACAELGVTAVEPDKPGDREARLYGEDEECPVAQFSKDAG